MPIASRIAFATLAVAVLAAGAFAQAEITAQSKPAKPAASQPAEVAMAYVLMSTSEGDILIELDAARAPATVKNFLSYTNKGFYNGTIFHRVIANFMIQGGGFTPDMQQKSTDPAIVNEWENGLKNVTGSLAMARTANPNSATSQFFINVAENARLDQPISGGAGYAVFGKVVVGMDVVEKIRTTPTGRSGRFSDVPKTPVMIKKITQMESKEAMEAMKKAAGATSKPAGKK